MIPPDSLTDCVFNENKLRKKNKRLKSNSLTPSIISSLGDARFSEIAPQALVNPSDLKRQSIHSPVHRELAWLSRPWK
jgi:hypothetical protein